MSGDAPAACVLRAATPADADALCAIYNPYVETTCATFEETPVAPAEMARRIEATLAGWPWLVAEDHAGIAGFAYASQWKARSAYRHTAESAVYLDRAQCGLGLGSRLYAALLDELAHRHVHSVVACIALPHPASVALHEKFGYRKIAHFAEAGFKFNRWIDVGYWQRPIR